jgi:hypothetical protein
MSLAMRDNFRMIAWHRDLETARSAQEIARTAQAFLDALPSEMRAVLPPEVLPLQLEPEGIAEFTGRLNAAYWRRREQGEDPGVLEALWSFFLRASIQLARVDARARPRRRPSSRQAA